MATCFCIPTFVPLPCKPQLVKSCVEGTTGSQNAFLDLRQDEVLSIVSRSPGGLIYAAARRSPNGLREGWVREEHVRPLDRDEAADVTPELHLSLRELLQRSALVCADEDWFDTDDPATLGLRTGELLHVSTVSEGWAYGWSLESPNRRGWFPLCLVHKAESSPAALAGGGQLELSRSASLAVIRLVKASTPPRPLAWAWEGELPPAVAESAQHEERELREHLEAQEAQALAEESRAAGAQDPAEGGGAGASGETEALGPLDAEGPPEDTLPLAACIAGFAPPAGAEGALLRLEVGDLVRVTSDLDATMCYGFLEKKSTTRGWFPRRRVELLDDPLDPRADGPAVQLGPRPLPVVPPALLQRGRG
mmetsp:Transcript_144502/g.448684  ORF Transcript_144502/g.448684 Transcript_144502/m.448684 type:complete len:365 (+) Transcript_144502:37-1131(+)